MKLLTLLVLSLVLVSCGKTSSSKETHKGMESENLQVGDLGLAVKMGYLTNSSMKQVFVSCDDTKKTRLNTTNADRIEALKHYQDSLAGMDFVQFTDGTRTDTWKVKWTIDQAISRLELKSFEETCPYKILGNMTI